RRHESRKQRKQRADAREMLDEACSPAASFALITLWRPRHLSPEDNRRVGAERARVRSRRTNERREREELRHESKCEKERDEATDTDVW
ncbi:hypothetical protein ALC60_13579, partial [Trachymyrmex zeteki]